MIGLLLPRGFRRFIVMDSRSSASMNGVVRPAAYQGEYPRYRVLSASRFRHITSTYSFHVRPPYQSQISEELIFTGDEQPTQNRQKENERRDSQCGTNAMMCAALAIKASGVSRETWSVVEHYRPVTYSGLRISRLADDGHGLPRTRTPP